MSASTSIPKTARFRRSHVLAVLVAMLALIAIAAWAIGTYAVGSATQPPQSGSPTEASVLRSLTPRERQYVLGIMSLTPVQLSAAFGTGLPSSAHGDSNAAPASTAARARP